MFLENWADQSPKPATNPVNQSCSSAEKRGNPTRLPSNPANLACPRDDPASNIGNIFCSGGEEPSNHVRLASNPRKLRSNAVSRVESLAEGLGLSCRPASNVATYPSHHPQFASNRGNRASDTGKPPSNSVNSPSNPVSRPSNPENRASNPASQASSPEARVSSHGNRASNPANPSCSAAERCRSTTARSSNLASIFDLANAKKKDEPPRLAVDLSAYGIRLLACRRAPLTCVDSTGAHVVLHLEHA